VKQPVSNSSSFANAAVPEKTPSHAIKPTIKTLLAIFFVFSLNFCVFPLNMSGILSVLTALVCYAVIWFIPNRNLNSASSVQWTAVVKKGLFIIMTSFKICASLFVFALAMAAPQAAIAQEDPVVAVVNGIKIVRSEIEDARLRLPKRLSNVPLQSVYGMLVNSLVDTKLVAAEARKINLQNDKQVRKQLARIKEQILERAFLTSYIEKRITEAALAGHYEKMVMANMSKEEVHARHILLETKAQAREVIKELEGGADFAELAKTRSTGPSASKGGDLDFFAEGQMVPAFSKAAFALNKGEMTTDPVQTQFGWHVIKVEDRRTLQPLPRAQVEDQLRMALSREMGTAYLQKLRQTATVQRFNLDGSPMTSGAPAQ
jgi:peptidyl-prolyl cis-trans isomerase C